MDHRGYIRDVSRPLVPKPTGVEPKIALLDGVRAVVFDIYGTLVISDAGEIGAGANERRVAAMGRVIDELGRTLDVASLVLSYDDHIERALLLGRKLGVDCPEVEIREVWRDILHQHSVGSISDERIEEIAIIYECASNPVWPMPEAGPVLEYLDSAGLKLGIISNAQFYTPIVLESLFEATLHEMGFADDWMVYSYRLRQGKPSSAVYEVMKIQAETVGILPDEILYVGNDMVKDVEPAAAVGFKTCLFAGDGRSLRLGNGGIEDAKRLADAIVTSLDQIPNLLAAKL